ncbi:uncharacterized protein LOC131252593 isoform X2 [Magnolia sinica]|uniref:uncharacterized protein LOC131252593 isoform X2 n=1 Tax=Magnolia sinica TaxID=86752 RepID=UPI0026590058|nr:uncharacterized protein LOC131252593 isoform X2 [Magnolia sinica]
MHASRRIQGQGPTHTAGSVSSHPCLLFSSLYHQGKSSRSEISNIFCRFSTAFSIAMAPRGRSRKVGMKRIDAAIDALLPLGFSKELIRKTVDSLLKVYEGDSGWVFIEEASYKLVIESILEEQEKGLVEEKESCEDGSNAPLTGEVVSVGATSTDPVITGHVTEKGESSAAVTTCEAAGVIPTNTDPAVMRQLAEIAEAFPAVVTTCEAAGVVPTSADPTVMRQITETGPLEDVGWKDISCDKKSLGNDDEAGLSCSKHIRSPSCPRRKPCYGWISDNESEEEDAPIENEFPQEPRIIQCMGDLGQGRKRRSRWDVTPDSMHELFHKTPNHCVRNFI